MRLALRKQPEGTETLERLQRYPGIFARWKDKKVRIFSREHDAYWRPNGAGYTVDGLEAGIYSFEEAYLNTKHCGPEKRITLRIV